MPSCPPIGPGPGAYGLPPEVGFPCHDVRKNRLPMYSFGMRTPLLDPSKGPGPCYKIEGVSRYGPNNVAAYSLKSRHWPDEKWRAPGPGTYSPEKHPPSGRPNAPAFSMQGRTTGPCAGSGCVGPGPCAYSLPSTMGDTAFSMAARREAREMWRSPGPASYTLGSPNVYKHRDGAFSLGSRSGEAATTRSPGPAAYYSRYAGGKGPYSFSFGTRHSGCAQPFMTPDDLCQ